MCVPVYTHMGVAYRAWGKVICLCPDKHMVHRICLGGLVCLSRCAHVGVCTREERVCPGE
jgi:hypothetical protein